MSYAKSALFIDTNIYLGFYEYSDSDLNSLEQLSASLEKEHFNLLVNQQLKDEFINNRAARIKKAFDEYKKLSFNQKVPTLFNNEIDDVINLQQAKKNYEKIYNDLLIKIQKEVVDETLKADLIIKGIFNKASPMNIDDKIHKKALQRMRSHNPPGKPNSIGDSIHWESLLSHVKKGTDLIIVSNDGDFLDDLYPLSKNAHSFLIKEWKKEKNSNLIYYKDLTLFLQNHMPKFELHDKVKDQITELILQLKESTNFSTTHEIITDIMRYFDHLEEDDITKIIHCYEENNQINWIIDDPDISELILNIKNLPSLAQEYKDTIDKLFQKHSNKYL